MGERVMKGCGARRRVGAAGTGVGTGRRERGVRHVRARRPESECGRGAPRARLRAAGACETGVRVKVK